MIEAEKLRRLGAAAGLALGGSVFSALLLVAAQVAVRPVSLSEVVGGEAVKLLLSAIALLYIVGAGLYGYTLYSIMETWNRSHQEFSERISSARRRLQERGLRGETTVSLGMLEVRATMYKAESMLWGFMALPPVANMLTLYAVWSLYSGMREVEEKEIEAAERLAEAAGIEKPRLEGFSTPTHLIALSLLIFPLASLLSRLVSDLESHLNKHGVMEEMVESVVERFESRRPHDAWIISIGNELLNGRTVNTNATWLGRKLTLLGYRVRRVVSCPDDMDEIVETVRHALSHRPGVIITTGGLGPTFDDKTSEALSKALGRRWVTNPEALGMVKEKYQAAGLEMTEHRVKLARMPEGAKPIPNPVGTAPGILVEHEGTLIAALPGVPREMKAMFEETLEPILAERGPRRVYLEAELRSIGVPESTAAPVIDRVMKISPNLYIKSHPSGGELDQPVLTFQVIVSAPTREEAEQTLKKALEELKREMENLGARIEEKAGGEGEEGDTQEHG